MNTPVPLHRRIRGLLTARFEHVIDWRIDLRTKERFADYERRIREATDTVAEQRRVIDEQRARIDELTGRFDAIAGKAEWSANELERIIPHVAAQTTQLEALHQTLSADVKSSPDEVTEAQSLIEQVRREHAQVRTRLTAIARYEERISRLEKGSA